MSSFLASENNARPGFGAAFSRVGNFGFITLPVLLLLAFTAFTSAADYRGLVVFGDSLSDMGNRWLNPNRPDNKFKDTWVALLAKPAMLNVPDFKPSGVNAFYGGGNYAVGGAGTEATAALNSERNRNQHLTQQVSKRYLNPEFNTNGVQKAALHIVVIGANDLMLASIGADQLLSQWTGLEKSAVAVAKSTESQIGALAAAGVKNVMWGNVFDVAQAPALKKRAQLLPSLTGVYLTAITKAARAHNAEMDAAIARLQQAHPGLQIIKLDLFARFAEVAANPAKFGFSDVTTGANDSQHLFSADGLHPTPQGQKMLAEYAFSVLSTKPPAAVAK